MSVVLSKMVHRWLHFVEEELTFCRLCGSVLENGASPASGVCSPQHDANCICDYCIQLTK